MLLLKPERSAIMRINPGGRLQADFVTVTGGPGPLDELPIKLKIGPTVRTMSKITTSAAMPTITGSLLDRIIEQ
jgi:hypothetical protein